MSFPCGDHSPEITPSPKSVKTVSPNVLTHLPPQDLVDGSFRAYEGYRADDFGKHVLEDMMPNASDLNASLCCLVLGIYENSKWTLFEKRTKQTIQKACALLFMNMVIVGSDKEFLSILFHISAYILRLLVVSSDLPFLLQSLNKVDAMMMGKSGVQKELLFWLEIYGLLSKVLPILEDRDKEELEFRLFQKMGMIEQFINFIIRPPSKDLCVQAGKAIELLLAEYDPDQYLWEKEFTLAGRTYQRQDLEASMDILKNSRGYTLRCSHYLPSPFPEDIALPCVIYCHGNSGCRVDANEAAVILLPSNITVFTLDFSGSGLSDGDHVSLGWHEKDDLKMVVSHLRTNKQVSRIGLWGRSMGAVTSLLYGAEDSSVAGMVLDSAFSNLYGLMMELADVYKIRLPKFTVKMAVQYMRRVIEKKAKFDIMDLNCLLVAPKTFIPVLFGHGIHDQFIQPHHSDRISESYAGEKNIIKFDGDHNSSRPQLFYDSVSIFFYNVLRPPHIPRARKHDRYFDIGDLKIGPAVNESLLYGILSNLQSVTIDAASSSSALPRNLNSNTASIRKLIPKFAPESMIREELIHGIYEPGHDDHADMKDEQNGLTEDYYSYTSSTRESWGRCSSLVFSDEESCPDYRDDDDASEVFATPLGSLREISADPKEEENDQKKKKKKKKKAERSTKKHKSDRFEKWESLGRKLRLCILKGSANRRPKAS
ncbi:unnamed protein product [Sphenostylis stenocarpa]|uniref:Serine aminopeptidase S33 domain-containing protein n=1 Tax=Sphenostylis stenocarpa TaxID=92480 RepID=A0AA86SK04_9FABA|nr:unnamed protein product [Sphenostylis stenocarpa]